LYYDYNIEDKYKDISLLLDLDLKSKLIDKRVVVNFSQKILIHNYKFDDMVIEIQKMLKSKNVDIDEFYKNILCLKFQNYEKQNLFLSIIKDIYGGDWLTQNVTNFSNDLFDLALDFWIQKVCKDICECGSIEMLTSDYLFIDEISTIKWLSRFINYITKYNMDHLLDRVAILPNQNGDFKKASELSLDSGEIEEVLKDVCEITGYNIRETLLMKDIFLKLPKNRTVKNDQFADKIINYIRANKNKLGKTPEEKNIFQNFYNYLRIHRYEEQINSPFNELCSNLHWFYNDDDISVNMQKVEEYSNILSRYGVSGVEELEKILSRITDKTDTDKIEISREILAQWGISTLEELERALANNILDHNYIYTSNGTTEIFIYVQEILERSKNNILIHLNTLAEYDIENVIPISNTIFIVKKNSEEIYIIARPSDYSQIIIYYDSEIDILDYEKDCELWIEDGKNTPEKITFGKILRLTGVNKIPLRRLDKHD
jgi:hypothetical protein